MKNFVFFLLLFFNAVSLAAPVDSDSERKVGLDWEVLEGAQSYDIEIGPSGQTKPLKTEKSIPQNRWTGLLAPGKYWMRVRGRDERDVPGEWSDKSEVLVKLPKVDLIRPASDTVLNSNQEKTKVLFEWKPVPGAKLYSFVLETEDGKLVEAKKTPATSTQAFLPATQKYRWSVQALDQEEHSGERESSISQFTVEGPPLAPPVIKTPETVYVRRIEFERPTEAEGVDVRVQHFDPQTRDWVVQKQWKETKSGFLFPSSWPGGKYQISMETVGKYRAPSSVSEITFEAFNGARTAADENRALIRKSLDRTEGWFGQFSYVATQVQYSGVHFETDSKPSFNALTGTASVGVGRYWSDNPFGVNFAASFGGILVNGTNTTLLGQEVSGLWRRTVSDRAEIRASFGINRSEIPEASAAEDKTSVQVSKFSVLGPKFGAEYWHALNRKLGLQAHGFYTHALLGTASNGSKVSGHTLELGAMTSYRLTPLLTGLLGYTNCTQSFQSSGTHEITQRSGLNQVNLTAHYLHFMVEYDF